MSTQPRIPAGSSSGGQFAEAQRREQTIRLPEEPVFDETKRSALREYAEQFAFGFDEHIVDDLAYDLSPEVELMAAWSRHADGWFRGSTQLFGRLPGGQWRMLSADAWRFLCHGGELPECWLDSDIDQDMEDMAAHAEVVRGANLAWVSS